MFQVTFLYYEHFLENERKTEVLLIILPPLFLRHSVEQNEGERERGLARFIRRCLLE